MIKFIQTSIIFFWLALAQGCNSEPEDSVTIVFSEDVIEISDLLISITGAEPTNQEYFSMWLNSVSSRFNQTDSTLKKHFKEEGIDLTGVHAIANPKNFTITFSGKIDEEYKGHFRNTFVSHLNKIRLNAISNILTEFNNTSGELREMMSPMVDIGISRRSFDWEDLCISQ